VAVFVGVMLARLFCVMGGVQAVTVGNVGVMARLLVVTGFIMPGCLAVVLRSKIMMRCGFVVMTGAFVIFRHLCSSMWTA
jgi:hypothetical protein